MNNNNKILPLLLLVGFTGGRMTKIQAATLDTGIPPEMFGQILNSGLLRKLEMPGLIGWDWEQ